MSGRVPPNFQVLTRGGPRYTTPKLIVRFTAGPARTLDYGIVLLGLSFHFFLKASKPVLWWDKEFLERTRPQKNRVNPSLP